MKKHGGFLGTDKKPHQVSIKFHQLGGTRHEGDMDRAQIIREVAAGNLRTVKAGRLRGAVQSGDFELASAMMPESIKNKKGYFTLIAKQQKAVADAAAKKKVRKKKLTECFSAEKIEEFSKLLNEAQLVRGVIEQRKNKRLDVMKYILYMKVDQHPYVRKKLLETGNRQLIEDSWRDDYWGWGEKTDGLNT